MKETKEGKSRGTFWLAGIFVFCLPAFPLASPPFFMLVCVSQCLSYFFCLLPFLFFLPCASLCVSLLVSVYCGKWNNGEEGRRRSRAITKSHHTTDKHRQESSKCEMSRFPSTHTHILPPCQSYEPLFKIDHTSKGGHNNLHTHTYPLCIKLAQRVPQLHSNTHTYTQTPIPRKRGG